MKWCISFLSDWGQLCLTMSSCLEVLCSECSDRKTSNTPTAHLRDRPCNTKVLQTGRQNSWTCKQTTYCMSDNEKLDSYHLGIWFSLLLFILQESILENQIPDRPMTMRQTVVLDFQIVSKALCTAKHAAVPLIHIKQTSMVHCVQQNVGEGEQLKTLICGQTEQNI